VVSKEVLLSLFFEGVGVTRILVSGSRGWTNKELIAAALPDSGDVLIIHGGARGADRIAARIARERGLARQVFLPDWDKFGKKAGILRNIRMLDDGKPTEGMVFWDGKSRGAKHMLDLLRKAEIPTQLFVDTSDSDL